MNLGFLNPIQGGGQKRLRAPSSLNVDKNNHRMRLQIGCNFNLVYCRETEAKKGEIFWGDPPFSPTKKFQNPPKKIRGVNQLIKEVESEYSTLEDSYYFGPV